LIKGRLEQGVKVRQGFGVCKRCWEFHKDKENKTKTKPKLRNNRRKNERNKARGFRFEGTETQFNNNTNSWDCVEFQFGLV